MLLLVLQLLKQIKKQKKITLKENFNTIRKTNRSKSESQKTFSYQYLKISLKCQVLVSYLKDKTTLKVSKERIMKEIGKRMVNGNGSQKIYLGSDFVTNITFPFLLSFYIKIRWHLSYYLTGFLRIK